jgi:hypothetical protein
MDKVRNPSNSEHTLFICINCSHYFKSIGTRRWLWTVKREIFWKRALNLWWKRRQTVGIVGAQNPIQRQSLEYELMTSRAPSSGLVLSWHHTMWTRPHESHVTIFLVVIHHALRYKLCRSVSAELSYVESYVAAHSRCEYVKFWYF